MPSNDTENIYATQYGGEGEPIPATKISYNNTTSGLTADDVQEAIDELDGVADTLSTGLSTANGAIGTKANKTDLTNVVATGETNTTGAVIPINYLFYLDNELVRSKTAIGVDESFALNTNYEKIPLGTLNDLKLLTMTVVTSALKTYADLMGTGGKIEFISYSADNSDAPSAYDGTAVIIHMTSNYKTIIAFSRDGNMYQLCKAVTWGTWKTVTMT